MKTDISKLDAKIQKLSARRKALLSRTREEERKRRNHLLISFSSLLLQGKTDLSNLEGLHAWAGSNSAEIEKLKRYIQGRAFPSGPQAQGSENHEGNESHETEA